MCDKKSNILKFPNLMPKIEEEVFKCGTCGCQEFYILHAAFECCDCGMQIEITVTDLEDEDGSPNDSTT